MHHAVHPTQQRQIIIFAADATGGWHPSSRLVDGLIVALSSYASGGLSSDRPNVASGAILIT
jgi:hypothetical protein